jgi:hypothetical protein
MISSVLVIVMSPVVDPRDGHLERRSVDLAFKIAAALCRTLGMGHRRTTLAMARNNPSVQRRWSIYWACRGLQPRHTSGFQCLSRVRQSADMKLGAIMRRVIIRSLAVTAVFTGLLFTGAGVAGAVPPLNMPCYVLPSSCH